MATLKTLTIDGVGINNAELSYTGTTSVTVPSGTLMTIQFDGNPQLETNTWYAITLQANFPAKATGVRYVQNSMLIGTTLGALVSGMRTPACATGETILSATAVIVPEQNGEYIARVFQNSGSDMNVRFSYRVVRIG